MKAMKGLHIFLAVAIPAMMFVYWAICILVKNDNARTIQELKELDDTLKNDATDGEHFRTIDHYCEKAVDPDLSCVVGEKKRVN